MGGVQVGPALDCVHFGPKLHGSHFIDRSHASPKYR